MTPDTAVMTPEAAALMADYNRWMNARLYDAAASLPAAELVADRGAFFGSLLATLNHIAVADTIWLQRFAQHPAGFAALRPLADLPRPGSLRQELAADLPRLRAYRDRLDAIILAWVPELTPQHLSAPLAYTRTDGLVGKRNFGALLLHFFNHQTHHRGQATTLLSQAGVDVGVTDLVARVPSLES